MCHNILSGIGNGVFFSGKSVELDRGAVILFPFFTSIVSSNSIYIFEWSCQQAPSPKNEGANGGFVRWQKPKFQVFESAKRVQMGVGWPICHEFLVKKIPLEMM